MQCKVCGEEFPSKYYFKEGEICINCTKNGFKYEDGEIKKFESIEEDAINSLDQVKTDINFNTLLGIGKFISGFGWVITILGIFVFIYGLTNFDEVKGFSLLASGILLVILGLLLIAIGQSISCFVAIEKNTRSTFEMMKYKLKVSKE